jgi:stress-induced-phosphoprotein 1
VLPIFSIGAVGSCNFFNFFLARIFQVFSNRSQCNIYLGALHQGLEDAEKCVKLDPTFLMGYLRKARVQFLLENYENSITTYLEGLKCDPNNLDVLDGLRR